jgi:hypothetical protein
MRGQPDIFYFIVTCMVLRIIYGRVLEWMIGFIDTLLTTRDYRQYGAIADLHAS